MKNIEIIGNNICQFRRIMKISLVATLLTTCLVVNSFASSVYAQRMQITLSLKNTTLRQAFNAIEKNSDFVIFYYEGYLDADRKISLNVKNQTVDKILDIILANTGSDYHIDDNQIFIVQKNELPKAFENPGKQQKKLVLKGIVADVYGEPVIGANVIEKGTTNGVVTDIDGVFSLSVSENATLQISYIGYMEQNIAVGSRTDFNIILREDLQSLDEVVVVGYGIQKKSVVTAAISRVTSKDLSGATPTRVEDVLKGKVSGVQITQKSGQPGATSVVRVRGIGTINNSDPLYIVDGIPVSTGIDYLNPRDIESVEILKDAASAAIYGARAANGVILITTKNGNIGKTTVSYQFSYGIQNPWRKRKLLNGEQYEEIMNEARLNAGQDPLFSTPSTVGKGTNWQNLIFNDNAPIVNHNASISGGSDKGTFYLSFGYIDQEGIVAKGKSDYERYNLRLNSSYSIFEAKERDFLKQMRIGLNIGYTKINQHGIEDNSEWGGPLFAATMSPPNAPLYEEDPSVIKELTDKYGNMLIKDRDGRLYKIISGSELANPVAMMQILNKRNATDKLVGSIWGEMDLMENLVFKTSYSIDLTFADETEWSPEYYLSETRLDRLSRIRAKMDKRNAWNFENTLRYSKSISDHNFAIMLGSTIQKSNYADLQGKNVNLVANMPGKDYLDFALGTKADQETSGGANEHALASFFGRLNYNYNERYLAEFVLRRDGSSNFPTDKKWAYFPSVSLGWNIHNESFFSQESFLNQIKLRASWGKNGNEAIGAFQYTSLIKPGANYIFGDDVTTSGMYPSRLVNRQVRWESSEQYDAGLDLRMFNNSLSATVDVFYKTTDGMLMKLPIPAFIGNDVPDGNVGSMINKGIEMELLYTGNVAGFTYQVGANASYMKNKIKDIGISTGYIDYATYGTVGVIQRHTTGLPVAHFFGTKAIGVFQNADQINNYRNSKGELIQPNAVPGDVIFKDINNDGVINDDDRTYLGKPNPDWTLGLNMGLAYKGFDLSMFWQGAFGGEIFDASRRPDLALVNYSTFILHRWHGEGTSNYYPRIVYANQDQNNNTRVSSLNIYNGNYFRLKNLQLGYTFPAQLTRKFYTQNLRLYVTCENLLTFTDYHGGDPEVGASMGQGIGVDRGIYPQARTISFGASITF